MLNSYHVTILTYLLEKLKATPDGDGNLLDHSMVLYGSAMGDGNQHNHDPLPIVLAGGASGRLKGGRHIRNAQRQRCRICCWRCSTSWISTSTSLATARG